MRYSAQPMGSVQSWGGRLLLAFLVTLVAVVVTGGLRRLLEGLAERIEGFERERQQAGPHTAAVLLREVVLRAVLLVVRLARIVATAAVAYLWVMGVAYFVDPTHALVSRLLSPVKEAALSLGATLLGVIPNLLIRR